MNEPTPPITGQAAKLTTTKVNDDTTLVCVVHLNAKPVFAECCAVARDGTSRRIGKSPEGWKLDSASATAFNDGTVRLWLSSYPDGASGTEAAVRYIDFVDAVPPASTAGGGEVYAPAPGGYIRIFSHTGAEPPLEGQHTISLPASIPTGCAGLQLRMMASAGAANVRAFVGPDTNEGAMLPCYIQVAGVRTVIEGRRGVSAQHTLSVAAPYGPMAELYIDVLGWWS